MKKIKTYFKDILIGLSVAFIIFFLANLVVTEIKESKIIKQSTILSSIIREDSLDISAIIKDDSKKRVMEKFIIAVTDAYVSFEHIPYSEGDTLVALMNSLTKGINIDGLKYSGRDLIITGSCDNLSELVQFEDNLKETDRFADTESSYSIIEDKLEFTLLCKSTWNNGNLEIFNGEGFLQLDK